jgi:hypothetical protein
VGQDRFHAAAPNSAANAASQFAQPPDDPIRMGIVQLVQRNRRSRPQQALARVDHSHLLGKQVEGSGVAMYGLWHVSGALEAPQVLRSRDRISWPMVTKERGHLARIFRSGRDARAP